MSEPSMDYAVDLETLQRFDRPGPRYTSYPTAVEFHEGVGVREYRGRLAAADSRGSESPLSLYIHLPFCHKRCDFCACHVVATPHVDVGAQYLEYLHREIDLVAAQLPNRRTLAQMHWGGGTPTYFSPTQLRDLFGKIRQYFELAEDAELAIEVDPRVTTAKHLETLAELGFNRLSLGIQDFTPEVQEAIGRGQTRDETLELVGQARRLGFQEGINFDLVYGLPQQTLESFNVNLEQILDLRPNRLAIYSFAFVPWIKPNQRRLNAEDFPTPALKLELYLSALNRLLQEGYVPIGMDHFALPDDELGLAAAAGRLERNFMGYTVKPAKASVALGVSAIGDLENGYFQNAKKLPTYYQAIERGELPIERGCLLDEDDRLRRHVIMRLMCRFRVDKRRVGERFDIEFDDYFAESLAGLSDLVEAGFVRNTTEAVTVSPQGRLFVRNAAMAFDRYLAAKLQEKRVFSRTV